MSRVRSMACPHCSGPAAARSSRELSRLYREASFQCKICLADSPGLRASKHFENSAQARTLTRTSTFPLVAHTERSRTLHQARVNDFAEEC
ncbi:ogr/Delta-like zinc finger family protein [Lysobacter capsici]|nr:ogr/Delta-like zinc finger family protein [Lysobacter capsici]